MGPEAQELFFKASDDVLSQNEVYDFMQPVFGQGIVYDATKKNRQVQFQTMANGLRASRLKVRSFNGSKDVCGQTKSVGSVRSLTRPCLVPACVFVVPSLDIDHCSLSDT